MEGLQKAKPHGCVVLPSETRETVKHLGSGAFMETTLLLMVPCVPLREPSIRIAQAKTSTF